MHFEWDDKKENRWDRRDKKRRREIPPATPTVSETRAKPQEADAPIVPENQQARLKPGLYLVATPIGNLGDISKRAIETLAGADMIACEDSRVTGALLHHLRLEKRPPLLPYHDHNAERARATLLQRLMAGGVVALVSDAGLPLVSDPGYKLVRECIAHGIFVSAIPGANAALTALQLSGLPPDRFFFAGFLPPKTHGRKTQLEELKSVPGTLLFYETGPRLAACLADMAEILGGERPAAIARELTKLFEEVRRGALSDLAAGYASEPAPKGEIVIVVSGQK